MQNLKYYIGIDLGGTQIKGGVVDSNGKVVLQDKIDTQSSLGNEKVLSNIITLSKNLMRESKSLNITTFDGIGLGMAGIVDVLNGVCICAYNLNFYNFPIVQKLEQALKLKVKIINDANASTLAEYNFGAGKGTKNMVMLTLGTGVGGGAIIEGKLLKGNNSAGAEFGHSVICIKGNKCPCGRHGCLEQYVSATALTLATKQAMEKNRHSKMWEIGSLDNVTAKTAFDYSNVDETANNLVNSFLNYLAIGLTNIANVFRPEVIVIGGGIANQGKTIIEPLQKMLNSSIYAPGQTPKVKISTAKLGDLAGVVGSVCNFFCNEL